MTDMIRRISAIAPMTGYGHTEVRKSLDVGTEHPKAQEVRVQRILEQQRKIVSPLYNLKGKLIEYDNSGRHLDLMA